MMDLIFTIGSIMKIETNYEKALEAGADFFGPLMMGIYVCMVCGCMVYGTMLETHMLCRSQIELHN
jgi:rubrerythrin